MFCGEGDGREIERVREGEGGRIVRCESEDTEGEMLRYL